MMLTKMGTLQSSLPTIACPQAIWQYNELQPLSRSQMKKYVASLSTLNQLHANIIKSINIIYNIAPNTCLDDVNVRASPEDNSIGDLNIVFFPVATHIIYIGLES